MVSATLNLSVQRGRPIILAKGTSVLVPLPPLCYTFHAHQTSVQIWGESITMVEVGLEQLGPYTNIRLLNESSTGHTYLGKHQQRKKYVVIKVFRTPFDTPDARETFLAHAKKLKKLKHRNIAEIQDVGFISSTKGKEEYGYHVIQYVLEDTITQRFAAGQQNKPDEVKRVLSIVADALNYAH